MERRHPRVVSTDEVPVMETKKVFGRTEEEMGAFGARIRRLADATGGKMLGCSLIEVDPGKTAFPLHFHLANEESILIVAGSGTMRIGKDEVAVRAGDYVAFPVGLDHAHQLKNTGSEVLRYYCFSTLIDPEVCGYPDSKKIGVMSWRTTPLRAIYREEETRDYYDREPTYGKK